MNSTPNAFVSMDHLRRWARSALLATLAIVVGNVALGEQKKSGVQVDLSVLEEMGPRKPISSTDRVVVRRPGEAGPGQAARPARASVRPAASPPPTPRTTPDLGADLPAMRASDEPVEEAIEAAASEEAASEAEEAAQDVEPEASPVPAEEATEAAEAVPAEDAAEEPAEVEAADESGEETTATEDIAEAEETTAPTEPLETVQVESRPALGPVDEVEAEEETEAAADPDEASEAETEQAALLPSAGGAGSLRVLFKPGSADLSDEADDALDSLADRMNDDPDMRIELLAYAPSDEVEERLARRLSLSRALAIRLYLTEEGVAGTRTLVRALGGSTDEGPADRVDVVPAGQ